MTHHKRRLLQWHLHTALAVLSQCESLPAHVECRLRRGFAAQLEAGGQWQEAVYVMLRVEQRNPSAVVLKGALDAARSIFERHGAKAWSMGGFADALLSHRLRVPESWAASAATIAALYERRDDTVAAALAAEWWGVAHSLLVHRVLPRVLMRPAEAEAGIAWAQLAQLEHVRASLGPDWDRLGGPILVYQQLVSDAGPLDVERATAVLGAFRCVVMDVQSCVCVYVCVCECVCGLMLFLRAQVCLCLCLCECECWRCFVRVCVCAV